MKVNITESEERYIHVSNVMMVSGVNSLLKLPVIIKEPGTHMTARNNESQMGYLKLDEVSISDRPRRLIAIKAIQVIRFPN